MADTAIGAHSVQPVLDRFVAGARDAFGADLVSIVLFGSGAEDALRPTSDLNLVVVLKRFDAAAADRFAEIYRFAQAAGRAGAMFLREDEIAAAADAFAVKFLDISTRHRVLHGSDPFAALSADREAVRRRLRQVLLNLELRLRELRVAASGQPDRLVGAFADAAGPLRAAASAITWLAGRPVSPPKAALTAVCAELGGGPWDQLLGAITAARTEQPIAGEPEVLFARLLELTDRLQSRAAAAP